MVSHNEDEELAQLKDFWLRYGSPLLTGVLIAVAVVFGWKGWERYQAGQAQSASVVYQQLLETALVPAEQVDAAKVSELSGQLKKDFSGTAYAQYGSLFVAKVAVDMGKLDEAAAELQAVMADPKDVTLAELSRQRLARVLMEQGKGEEALALLEGEADKAFASGRLELKGDLLVQMQRPEEARDAYEKAKELAAEDATARLLQIKLDDLSKGDA